MGADTDQLLLKGGTMPSKTTRFDALYLPSELTTPPAWDGTAIFSAHIIDENPVHTRISVFNRGGLAGRLCVNTYDAALLIARLTGQEEP